MILFYFGRSFSAAGIIAALPIQYILIFVCVVLLALKLTQQHPLSWLLMIYPPICTDCNEYISPFQGSFNDNFLTEILLLPESCPLRQMLLFKSSIIKQCFPSKLQIMPEKKISITI